jgi:hypothetical protein
MDLKCTLQKYIVNTVVLLYKPYYAFMKNIIYWVVGADRHIENAFF